LSTASCDRGGRAASWSRPAADRSRRRRRRRRAAAPVGIAAGIVLEVGTVDRLRSLAVVVAVLLGARTFGDGRFALRARRVGERRRRDDRLVLALGLLEQRILLQHPLDLRIQLDRRQLQQANRLLQLWSECEVLAELELEGLLHALRKRIASEAEMLSEVDLSDGFIINNLARRARCETRPSLMM
jgi:hypothetical protein